MNNAGLIELLKNSQIFGFLDEEILVSLSEKFSLEFFSHGEPILHEEETNKDLYVVYSGKANVVMRDGARTKTIATYRRGNYFGENAILEKEVKTHDIVAIGDVVLAKLSYDDFKTLCIQNQEFENFLQVYSGNQALQAFFKNFGSFGSLTAKETSNWLFELNYENIRSDGEIVFSEGEEGDKFYIIAAGAVEVSKNINGNDVVLTTLVAGKFFGEMALISDTPRAATIKCLGDTQLVSIDKDHFKHMINSNPALSSKINNIIEMYKASGVPKDAFLQKSLEKSRVGNIQEEEINEGLDGFNLITANTPLSSMSACALMLMSYYGVKVDRDYVHDYINRIDYSLLEDIFNDVAFMNATAINLKYSALKKIKEPFITKLNDISIIVYGFEKNIYKVIDPSKGFLNLHKNVFKKFYDGEVMLVDKPSKNSNENKKITLHSFLETLLPYKKILAEILTISLFISILSLLPPIFIRILIDDVLVQNNENMLIVIMVSLIVVAIFTGLLNALRSYLQFFLSSKLQVEILGRAYSHLISLPLSYFHNRNTGQIMSSLEDGRVVERHLSQVIFIVLIDGITALAFTFALAIGNIKLFLIFSGFVLIFGGAVFTATYYARQYLPKTLSRNASTDPHTIESINNISVIKTFNAANFNKKIWEEMFINKLRNLNKSITINSVSNSAITAMKTLTIAVVLGYASMLALSNEISIGEALAFNMIAMLALTPLGNIIQIYNEIYAADDLSSGLNKIYSVESESGLNDKKKPDLYLSKADVEFKNVSFSYEKDSKKIISNFNLQVEHGEYVAILGRIGSGKSTLINLLTRSFNPDKGTIFLDNKDISQVKLASLRSHIGVVFQDTNLFMGTIRSNISIGMQNATLAQVVEAATLAGAHDFIINMPKGYDSQVGEKGMGLSGGEKRLIAIARALVSNPPILIMDEPTNDLDSETEQTFKDNLKTIGFGRTMFIITHKSSLIRDADKIVVMDEGTVVESGKHLDLIADRGYYFYLSAKQIELS
ncbi:cyclic nucleotide-binding domain-containing protein [Sulfurimonas aquatica]|uniref:Cyclic nucleotide-binding domain-containing protein n=1 Tax=Sulfurimonas aquatica TaxID=2672570 RepID=A0A975B0J2_9BACT|nr:peptidase domain-containing ABC transporter [Sulfurimonas aquatica]QSZ41883.1 cyclic nucleotide-binding domain-containing protein [Sulfurimonas aquatica]